MTKLQIDGLTISDAKDRVVIEVRDGRWEGSAAEAERVLTGLHYALSRARPGTNIASVLLNGTLWGGKSIETDRAAAVRDMRVFVNQLSRHLAELDDAG